MAPAPEGAPGPLRVAGDLGAGATVVTVMCDSGLKYLHG